jgi:hypothetical protein
VKHSRNPWIRLQNSGRLRADLDELLLYSPDRNDAATAVVTHVLPLDEVPGYDGGPFVSLSIRPLRQLSGEAVLKELETGSFG